MLERIRQVYSITGVPCALLSRSKENHLFPAPDITETYEYNPEIVHDMLKEYHVPIQTPFITIVANSTLIGALRIDEDLLYVLGPVANHSADLHYYLAYMNSRYESDLVSNHMKLVYGAPRVDIQYFSNILIHITNLLCHKTVTLQDMILSSTATASSGDFSSITHFYSRSNVSAQQLSFDNEVFQLVKNGELDVLKKKLDRMHLSTYYFFQENSIHYLRFAFLFYASILCHYASLGGVPGDEVKSTLSKYMNRLSINAKPKLYWRLLPEFSLELCRKVKEEKEKLYESDIINISLAYIKENLYHPITIDDLELETHATGKTILRHFKKYLDTTPAHYISEAKLEEAAYLLSNTELRIIDIAHLLNYSSQTHFNKNFSKKYGCTPLQYRKEAPKIP